MLALAATIAAILLAETALAKRTSWPRRWLVAAGVGVFVLLVLVVFTIPSWLYFQKVIGQLVMPVGLVWLGLLIATLFAWHKRRRRLTAAFAGFWLAFTLAGNQYLGSAMYSWLERDVAHIRPMAAGPYDAVFVMGGGSTVDPFGEPILDEFGDRLFLAARLYHAGRTPILVSSGSTIPGMGERDYSADVETLWISLGIPRSAIVRISEPRNSSEEIRAYKQLTEDRRWQRVGLISSAWHLRRALRLCRKSGFDAEPLPADFRGSATSYDGLITLIPTGAGFDSVETAAWEMIGSLVGR